MIIRRMRMEDVKAASEIVGRNYSRKYQNSSAREFSQMFTDGPSKPTFYVAVSKGVVCGVAGFIQSWMDYNVYQIFWVNVDPHMQSKGIGKQLVKRLIKEISKKKSATLIQLTCKVETSSYYWQNFGFNTATRFDGKQYHLMVKDLVDTTAVF